MIRGILGIGVGVLLLPLLLLLLPFILVLYVVCIFREYQFAKQEPDWDFDYTQPGGYKRIIRKKVKAK